MNNNQRLSGLILALTFFFPVHAHKHSGTDAHLPPLISWQGKSESLINAEPQWQTPAEASALTSTPDYRQTLDTIGKLAAQSRHIRLLFIGKSAQGRDIPLVVVTHQGDDDSQAGAPSIQSNGKPTLLLQAGIHAGEIDGKDAGLMLLRDIASGKEAGLIEQANLLFIPILSVDAHERTSPYNRVNQRGPENMGWRSNSRNLNLNRDYAKADTREIQALLTVIRDYQPDLYLDLHVTDGEDYQYDITYGFNRAFASQSANIANWLEQQLRPYLDRQLIEWGHKPGPLVFARDKKDFAQGISGWTASPRFSNGYGDVRQLPTILVENHSLKPYRQRVLGSYVLIKACLGYIGAQRESLRQAIAADVAHRPQIQVLDWAYDKTPEFIAFDGIDYQGYEDSITGQSEVKWTGLARHYDKLPQYWQRIPKVEVRVPAAYIIPPQYHEVISRLKQHGIAMTQLTASKAQSLEQLGVESFEFGKTPFEGRMQVTASFNRNKMTVDVPQGAVRIATDQPLGRLATALLEPEAPDSFFRWGFFNSIFGRTEYIENYAIIPLAEKMLAANPRLRQAFEEKLKNDQDFAADPRARLDFFYRQTPYYDRTYLQYPVLIER